MTDERRAAPRVIAQHPVVMEARVPGRANAVIESSTDDLSVSAFRCVCDQPIQEFTRVQVVITLPSTDPAQPDATASVECDGIVVRREEVANADGTFGYRVVVFLDHTTPAQRAVLDRVVGRHLGGADPAGPTAP